MNKKLTEDEVQQTMDFVKNVFAPTDPEMHAAVQARVDPKFFEDNGAENILLQKDLDAMFEDDDTKHVLSEINARKPIHKMYDSKKDFASEVIHGYTIHLGMKICFKLGHIELTLIHRKGPSWYDWSQILKVRNSGLVDVALEKTVP